MNQDTQWPWRRPTILQQQPRWRPTSVQVLWAGGVVGLAFLLIVICGYLFGLKWTGLPKRTLWDWLDLLIIPAVLAVGGYLFTSSENRATQAAAERRAQDEALQAYLDQMSAMLLPNKDQPSLYKAYRGDSLSSVARARTLTVLPRLATERKARVVQFLYESGLITKDRVIVDLRWADLSGAFLGMTYLSGADLSGTYLGGAFLRGANLVDANLSDANLSGAILIAILRGANLSNADLRGADLSHADLSHANLSHADLSHANLSHADLRGANLSRAALLGANLTGANVTDEQLAQGMHFKGATMPNGQRLRGAWLEPWLSSKGREEDGENSGPS